LQNFTVIHEESGAGYWFIIICLEHSDVNDAARGQSNCNRPGILAGGEDYRSIGIIGFTALPPQPGAQRPTPIFGHLLKI
jgi:hypothetical protein